MRAGLLSALGVTAWLLLAAHAGGAARTGMPCPTSAGMQDASKHSKPSSFAPRPRPEHNAYGAPIGAKILTRPVKKKPPSASSAPPPSA